METIKSVENYLDEVDYSFKGYVPSAEALMFVNFIKEVNGGAEENETPLLHLVMMDRMFNAKRKGATMVFRGAAKTTLFAEYLILFMAAFGRLPGFGKVNLALYITDSIENGVKNLRRNVEHRYSNSEFLQQLIPNQKIQIGSNGGNFTSIDDYEEQSGAGRKFTDIRLEFVNNKGHQLVIKGYGAKALALDTRLYTKNGYTTIKDCVVGQEIYGPDGEFATITAKSEVFNKPMYKLELEDGRFLKVSEDHINSVMVNVAPNGIATWEEHDLTTKELLDIGWEHVKIGNLKHKGLSYKCTMKIKSTDPLVYPFRDDLEVAPYTLGLILGDGSIKRNASGIVITGEAADVEFYRKQILYELGDNYLDARTESVTTFAVKGINQQIRNLNLAVHGNNKFIPEDYFISSIEQRLELLKGLLDTDGSIYGNGRITFVSASETLVNDTARLVRSLGGKVKKRDIINAYLIEIWIGMNPFKLPRKAERYVPNRRNWNTVNVVDISRIADEPSQCIAIDSESHQFLAGEYFRTHNTGVRGAKEMGQRPTLAIMDDLVSDEDARSATVIDTIENTVHKAVSKALHPTKQKTIWLGTPFNQKDPLYKAVESGRWEVNCFPICERFPVPKEEFVGAWEDRFPYEYVKSEYDDAIAMGRPQDFYQELMLRVMNEDDRVIMDDDIVWYDRKIVLDKMSNFNYYITTDLSVSAKDSADYGAISVWAITNNNEKLWVDGILKRQKLSEHLDDLFRLVRIYKKPHGYIEVGLELDGQQGGFIDYIKERMLNTNTYFTIAREKGKTYEGIRGNGKGNKHTRFMRMQPEFSLKRIWLPKDMKDKPIMQEAVTELRGVSNNGFKSKHDDWLDTVTQLYDINLIMPSDASASTKVSYDNGLIFETDIEYDSGKNSLIF